MPEARVTNDAMGMDIGYEADLGGSKLILLDSQQWTSKNLNVDHFANGVKIKEAKTVEEWSNANKNQIPAWCYYNNDPRNGSIYGKLYNWFAVMDPRKLCPIGWRVPADEDWNKLATFIGTMSASKLKSSENWMKGKNGADAFSFTGLPAASRTFKGEFAVLNEQANWWSSTEEGSNIHWAIYRNIKYNAPELFRAWIAKGSGLSVRCVME
jgi:uncharacterized protein (TIGR02145 family)